MTSQFPPRVRLSSFESANSSAQSSTTSLGHAVRRGAMVHFSPGALESYVDLPLDFHSHVSSATASPRSSASSVAGLGFHGSSGDSSPLGRSSLGGGESPLRLRRSANNGALRLHFRFDRPASVLHVMVMEIRELEVPHLCPGELFVRGKLLSDGKRFKRKTKKRLAPAANLLFNDMLGAGFKKKASQLRDEVLCFQVCSTDGTIIAETFCSLQKKPFEELEAGVSEWASLQPVKTDTAQGTNKMSTLGRLRRHAAHRSTAIPQLMAWLEEQIELLDPYKTVSVDDVQQFEMYRAVDWSSSDWIPRGLPEVWELFCSEISYFFRICLVCDEFKSLMALMADPDKRDNRIQGLLTTIDLGRLFGNIEDVQAVSLEFLQALEQAIMDPETNEAYPTVHTEKILEAFDVVKHGLLEREESYKEQPCREYFQELLGQNDQQFNAFIDWCEKDLRCEGLSFESLLAETMQRKHQYPALLAALSRQISNEDPLLKRKIRIYTRGIEDTVKRLELAMKRSQDQDLVSQLEQLLVWSSPADSASEMYLPHTMVGDLSQPAVTSLASARHCRDQESFPERHLQFQGRLYLLGKSGTVMEKLNAYLIDEILLLTTNRKRRSAKQRVYKRPLHLSEIEVLNLPASDPFAETGFMILEKDGFGVVAGFSTFNTDSPTEKSDWMSRLRIEQIASKAARPSMFGFGSVRRRRESKFSPRERRGTAALSMDCDSFTGLSLAFDDSLLSGDTSIEVPDVGDVTAILEQAQLALATIPDAPAEESLQSHQEAPPPPLAQPEIRVLKDLPRIIEREESASSNLSAGSGLSLTSLARRMETFAAESPPTPRNDLLSPNRRPSRPVLRRRELEHMSLLSLEDFDDDDGENDDGALSGDSMVEPEDGEVDALFAMGSAEHDGRQSLELDASLSEPSIEGLAMDGGSPEGQPVFFRLESEEQDGAISIDSLSSLGSSSYGSQSWASSSAGDKMSCIEQTLTGLVEELRTRRSTRASDASTYASGYRASQSTITSGGCRSPTLEGDRMLFPPPRSRSLCSSPVQFQPSSPTTSPTAETPRPTSPVGVEPQERPRAQTWGHGRKRPKVPTKARRASSSHALDEQITIV